MSRCDTEGCHRQADWNIATGMHGGKEMNLCSPCKNAFHEFDAWNGSDTSIRRIGLNSPTEDDSSG